MRMAGLWMTLILGGMLMTGAALAQSQDSDDVDDEEQGTSEKKTSSSSMGAALAQSSVDIDEEQSRTNPTSGIHVWTGRLPSRGELQSRAKSRTPSVRDEPDFQNGRIKVWIGKLPKLGRGR